MAAYALASLAYRWMILLSLLAISIRFLQSHGLDLLAFSLIGCGCEQRHPSKIENRRSENKSWLSPKTISSVGCFSIRRCNRDGSAATKRRGTDDDWTCRCERNLCD